MIKRHHTKLIHEGQYIAEVDVDLLEDDNDWSPCLSVEDANKLDTVRDALKSGNIKKASQSARIFNLTCKKVKRCL